MKVVSILLEFIPYKDFDTWDVKQFINSNLSYSYNVVKLNSILSKAKIEWVDIEDERDYPILGVRSQGQGVYINRVSKGAELTMKRYQKSLSHHLFYCKVRTVGGQWGIVYPQFEDSYGSSNMHYLQINEKIITVKYLELLLKVKRITDEWDLNAIGADGRHFPLKTLLTLNIPLPSLNIQRKMVKAYQEKIELAKRQIQQAEQKERDIETYLYQELGVEAFNEEKQSNEILQFIHSQNLNKWTVKDLLSDNLPSSKIYQTTTLSEIITEKPKYGSNSKGVKKATDIRYIRITDINEDGSLNDEVVSAETVNESYVLNQDDFLIARSGNTVGKTFLYDKKYGKCLYAGYLIKFILNKTLINPLYLLIYSKGSLYKKWISSNLRIAGQPNINSQEYLTSPIILPPLKVQNKIANHTQIIKNEIKLLKKQAEKNQKTALSEFENEIFA